MNIYMIVEGAETETKVYPEWLQILAPFLRRVDDAWEVEENTYYLFSGGGIPSIFQHISNAIADVNQITRDTGIGYDYLMVCMDTEEEDRDFIERKINEQLLKDGRALEHGQLVIFEQKVCMETWFLGNRVVFKENPQNQKLSEFVRFYNVKTDNPELMGNFDEDEFATKAQFHYQYLRDMFRERNIRYSKNNPREVCSKTYLDRLIERYEDTGHIESFGKWYEFVKKFAE